jgi:hypothetical protein
MQIQFKFSNSVHHHTIQINQPTRCKNFSSLLLDVYGQLNMFRESSRPSSGAQQQLDATISQVYYLTFMDSSTCFGRPHAHHQELNNNN